MVRVILGAVCLLTLVALFTNSERRLAAAVENSTVQVGSDPSVVGQWSAPVSWPVVAVHAVLMHSGNVLVWQSGATAKVWNPASGVFTNAPDPFTDIFCNGHVHHTVWIIENPKARNFSGKPFHVFGNIAFFNSKQHH